MYYLASFVAVDARGIRQMMANLFPWNQGDDSVTEQRTQIPCTLLGGGGCWCVHTSSYRGSECTRSAECTLIIPKPANLQSAPNTSPVIWLGYHGNRPITVHIISACCLHLGCTAPPTNRVHRAYFAGRLWRHLLQYLGSSRPKQTRDVDSMLFQCWAAVEYGGPTIIENC